MSRAAFRFMLLVWRLPNLMKDWPVLQTRSTEMPTKFHVGDSITAGQSDGSEPFNKDAADNGLVRAGCSIHRSCAVLWKPSGLYRQLCARDQRQAAGKESRDTGFPSRGHQSPESSALINDGGISSQTKRYSADALPFKIQYCRPKLGNRRGVSGGHFLRSEDDPHGSQEARRHTHRTTFEGIPSASRDDSARACRRRPRNAGANQPL